MDSVLIILRSLSHRNLTALQLYFFARLINELFTKFEQHCGFDGVGSSIIEYLFSADHTQTGLEGSCA